MHSNPCDWTIDSAHRSLRHSHGLVVQFVPNSRGEWVLEPLSMPGAVSGYRLEWLYDDARTLFAAFQLVASVQSLDDDVEHVSDSSRQAIPSATHHLGHSSDLRTSLTN